MKPTVAPQDYEEVLPLEAEEMLHHDHVPDRWSGAAWLDKTLEWIVGAAILAELVVILLNITVRVITGDSVLWTQEVSEIALLTIAFIGGAIAYPKGAHMSVQALIMRLPATWKPYLAALVDWLVFVMSGGALALFVPTLVQQLEEKTPILQLPVFWVNMPFSVGMVLIAWFALVKLRRQPWRPAVVGAGIAAVLVVVVLVSPPLFYYASPNVLLVVVLVALFGLLFLGLPIAFVLALASGIYLYLGGISDVSAIPIGMASGAKGFVLLAIPFFILAGTVMNSAGLTLPLAKLVDALIGHLRGGLLQVVVVTMYIFSGISGSKVADVAAVGTTMRGMLEERKYPRGEVVAVLSASAIMGETIPPSICAAHPGLHHHHLNHHPVPGRLRAGSLPRPGGHGDGVPEGAQTGRRPKPQGHVAGPRLGHLLRAAHASAARGHGGRHSQRIRHPHGSFLGRSRLRVRTGGSLPTRKQAPAWGHFA